MGVAVVLGVTQMYWVRPLWCSLAFIYCLAEELHGNKALFFYVNLRKAITSYLFWRQKISIFKILKQVLKMVVTENHPLIFKPNEAASSLLCRKTCPKPTKHTSAAEMPLLKPLSAVILGRYEQSRGS